MDCLLKISNNIVLVQVHLTSILISNNPDSVSPLFLPKEITKSFLKFFQGHDYFN